MVNTFRFGLIGVTDVNIEFAYLITSGFIVIAVFFSLLMLHKGIGIKN